MMLNTSFYSFVKEDMKKRAWLFWLSISMFLIVLPVTAIMQMDSVLHWSGNDIAYVKTWFVESQLGNSLAGFFLIAGAILASISSFEYLHSRQQLDFYYSLPIKREEWVLITYVSSFIQIMIPCILGYIIRYIIGMLKGFTGQRSMKMVLFLIGISILCYHLVYVISSIGMIVTGKILTGILMIGFFQLWYTFVLSVKEMVMGSVFETYISFEQVSGVGSAPYYLSGEHWQNSPIFLYFKMLRLFLKGESLKGVVGFAILSGIIFAVLTVVLYKIRPSEAAGKSVAFPMLEPIIKVLLAISIGVFFANMANMQYGTSEGLPVWAFVVGVLAAIFVCWILEFVFSSDVKMILQRKGSLLLSIVGTIGICMVLHIDLIGYDTYLPDKGKIASMSVDLLYNNPDLFDNSYFGVEGEEQRRLEKLKVQNFDRIYAAVENGISHVDQEIDLWDNEKYIPVKVAFYLKSGRVAYRKYFVDYDVMYQCMDSLFADRSYRRKYFDLDKLEKESFVLGAVEMYLGPHFAFPNMQERHKKLIQTYLEEMETTPFSVLENANLVAKINFSKGEEYMDYPVYKEFTKTIELLKKEFVGWNPLKAEDIAFISVEYKGTEDVELQKKLIEKDEMQQVLDHLSYVQTGFLGRVAEKDIYITIETPMGNVYNYFLKKGEVPDCLNMK